MIVVGEALKAEGDLAGARSEFEQTLTILQKIGATDLAAESQTELADLEIQENHPDKAESLVRTALAEFEKEKSDPDSSSAYAILSHALLTQGKFEEADKASRHAAELSLTSSDPALKLSAAIQQARVQAANPENRAQTWKLLSNSFIQLFLPRNIWVITGSNARPGWHSPDLS